MLESGWNDNLWRTYYLFQVNLMNFDDMMNIPVTELLKGVMGEELYNEVFKLDKSEDVEDIHNMMRLELGKDLYNLVNIVCRMDALHLRFADDLFPELFKTLKEVSTDDWIVTKNKRIIFDMEKEEKDPSIVFRFYTIAEKIISIEKLKAMNGEKVSEDEIGVKASWRIREYYPELYEFLQETGFQDISEKWRKVLRVGTRGKIDLQTIWEVDPERVETFEEMEKGQKEFAKKTIYIANDPEEDNYF